MPIMENTEGMARKVLPIIYVLDVSGSMGGKPIGALNQAMGETMPILREIEQTNTGAKIRIGAMTFASNVQWVSNGLEDIDDFIWNDVSAGGLTELGAALRELNAQMSRHAMLQSDTGFKLPVLLFLSDGVPTDDWRKELDKIKQENKWFINSTRIAIALGNDADCDALAEVVGNREAVIRVDELETLKSLIKVVSATASKIGSVSKMTGGFAGGIIQETLSNVSGDVTTYGSSGMSVDSPSTESVTAPVIVPAAGKGGWDDDDWE